MLEFLVGKFNYYIYIFLMMIGFYAMIGKRNLVKKLIGMNIFQWSIILYFVSIGAKKGGSIPIVEGLSGHGAHIVSHASQYVNPLPHVLMLTAIVVGVGTTGVALALLLRIYNKYKTLEEDEILRKMK
ncbi:MAG TPA: cation:proton antiporter subunit C [Nitrospinota bacterium]|nr:cation:proton antiporter subunit C [Nitrospinota bacterium]